MAEYRYYLIPDAMTRAFPEQFGKQTPTEFFDNIADLEKRYHQLREMPYNNERTWNERARFPYARLVVGVDRQNPDGEVAVIQVRNGINYLCDDYRGPYADGSDAQIPQMAKKLVEVIGVDRVRPHTYTQRDGYTWVQVEKDMHITEWLYAHELCSSLQFTRFLNRDGRELFQVRDGQRVIETNADGTKQITMALSMYVDGTMDLFAHQTNVDLQNHCICFNTVKLGKSMQSIGMMTVLDQIWNRITRNRVLGRRTWIFTDEFQLLLGNSACTNYYFELSSRARKWGAILTSITQHVRSVLNNEDARRMLSDCGYIKLLNQAPDDANDIARLLHISDEEKRYIENAEVGSGLLIADKVVVPFNNTFPQDTELFRLMDTNPNRKK